MEKILLILNTVFVLSLPLLAAWLLDRWLGDPAWLPHPVVAFGKMISFCDLLLNKGSKRGLKGAFVAIVLVLAVYFAAYYLFHWIASFSPGLLLALQILTFFFCLAGTSLIREVRMAFEAVDRAS